MPNASCPRAGAGSRPARDHRGAGPRQPRPARARRTAAALAVGPVLAVAALAGLAPAASASRRHSLPAPVTRSVITVAAQTSWVQGRSGLYLRLDVRSPLPAARLGLKFALYSRLTSRYAFDQSVNGTEPPSELPVDTPPTIPLGELDRRARVTGGVATVVTVHFPVTTGQEAGGGAFAPASASPTLGLDCGVTCDGVYPLEAALVDTAGGTPLSTITTHLIYTAGSAGTLPLGVALVLPAGTTPVLRADGRPALGKRQLTRLADLLDPIAANPRARLTLDLAPQLLEALQRDGSRQGVAELAALRKLFGVRPDASAPSRHETLGAPFAAVEPTALTSAGAGGELELQLARGAQVLASALGLASSPEPYVVGSGLDRAALQLLERDGVGELVLPSADATTLPGTPALTSTMTSPFRLVLRPTANGGTSGIEAFAADPGLAGRFSAEPSDPVLAAHQLLAELAEIYFDAPYGRARRAVVVDPVGWAPNARFLSTLLAGLSPSPVLATLTLTQAFAAVPVGGNGAPPVEQLVRDGAVAARDRLSGHEVASERRVIAVVRSVLPGDAGLLSRLEDAVLLGESAGLRSTARAAYQAVPRRAERGLSHLIKLPAGRTVTLTSRTGKIPVSFVSTSRFAVHAVVELSDPALSFGAAGRGPRPIVLAGKTTDRDYQVAARISGDSRLVVRLLSPVGGKVLFVASFSVRSTFVSAEAVALSIGAVLVLAAWWLRSLLRRRRAASRRTADAGEPPVVA